MYQWSIPDSKTHVPRQVWLPTEVATRLETTREKNKPRPEWPVLWDCDGIGFARVEDPSSIGFARVEDLSSPISPRTINGALERAREAIALPVRVTAHVAKHSYCTNWIREYGDGELAMEKLSRKVGTSVSVLRETYVHIDIDDTEWGHLNDFGVSRA